MEVGVNADLFEHLLFAAEPGGGGGALVAQAPERRAPARPTHAVMREPDEELEPEMAVLFGWLCERAGVRADDYRRSVFRRRAAACLRAVRCKSYAEALALGQRDPAQADRLLDAMLVGVTSFFRDPAVFVALRRRLAEWGTESETGGPSRSVLSVGCSDGAELYTCAMLLDSLGLLDRARLLGVDCRPGAIRAARAGEYRNHALDGLDEEAVGACFERRGGRVRVREHLRAACDWSVADAFADHGPASHDVVLCRNLAIYLSPEGGARLWRHAAGLTRPGGLLVVGKAERPPADLFWRVGPCLYERRGTAV